MTLHELFEKVTLKTPIEQRRFLNYFADTVQELQALYGYGKQANEDKKEQLRR